MVSFNNIIGHEEIIRHLQNAMKTGKVSHSYIFTGRPGSGKKLLATTYAMTLQCEPVEQSHVRNVTPVRRHWARIIRTSLWSIMRNLVQSLLMRSGNR